MSFRESSGWVTGRALAAFICGTVILAAVSPALAQRGRDEGRRDDGRRGRNEANARFTRSQEGRRFDRGVALRPAAPIRDRDFDRYFPRHYASYPHYARRSTSVAVALSPFGLYVGVLPSYIERRDLLLTPPPRIYVDAPVYVDGAYVVSGAPVGGYYLDRSREDTRWRRDPDLRGAVYDLEDAFRNSDITLLTPHVDPDTKIAVFNQGRYEYSMDPDDYLDLTRDFMRNAQTTAFDVYRVHQKADGVYEIFARHTYTDDNGPSQTVYLCAAMERIAGRWVLTQIDTSPARLQG